MVVLVAFGDQIQTRDPRAGGDAAKRGAVIGEWHTGPCGASPEEEVMLPLALGFVSCKENGRMRIRVSPCAHHQSTRPASHSKAALSPRERQMGALCSQSQERSCGVARKGPH